LSGNLGSLGVSSTVYQPFIEQNLNADPVQDRVTRYAYDNAGRQTFSIDALGYVTENVYDNAGRIIDTIRYANAITVQNNIQINNGTHYVYNSTTGQLDAVTGQGYSIQLDATLLADQTPTFMWSSSMQRNGQGYLLDYANPVSFGDPVAVSTEPGTGSVREATALQGWNGEVTLTKTGQYQQGYYDLFLRIGDGIVESRAEAEASALTNTGVFNYDNQDGIAFRDMYMIIEVDANGDIQRVLHTPTENEIRGQLVEAAAQDHHTKTVYDAAGRARYGIDALGYVTETLYDERGNITESIGYYDAVTLTGSETTVSDIQAALQARTAPDTARDQITVYVYDEADRITTETHALSAPEQYREHYDYDALGNVIRHQDGRGNYEYFAYDHAGRVTRHIDPMGYVVDTEYNEFGQVNLERSWLTAATVTPLAGDIYWAYGTDAVIGLSATNDVVDGNGQVITYGDRVKNYSYDHKGRLETETTPTVVDAIGNVVQGGVVTHYVYDAFDNTTDIVEAEGLVEQRTNHQVFNLRNQMIEQTRAYGEPESSTARFGYDAFGNQTSIVDPRGVELGDPAAYTFTQVFDRLNRKTDAIDPMGGRTSTEYDAFGNITKATDPNGNAKYFFYNQNNQISLQLDAEGYVTRTSFDANGNLETTLNYYREIDLTSLSAKPDQPEIEIALTNRIDPVSTRDQLTESFYDNNNRQIQVTDAEGYTESWTYDKSGNIRTHINKNGYAIIDPGLTGVLAQYYEDRRYEILGRTVDLTNLADADRIALQDMYTTVYTYYENNNLHTETSKYQKNDGSGELVDVTTRYTYDALGNRLSATEADGRPEQRVTNYQYDKQDRLTKTTLTGVEVYDPDNPDPTNRSIVDVVESKQYDAVGNVTVETDANGNQTFYFYDSQNRNVATIDAAGFYHTVKYDANGNAIQSRTYDDLITAWSNGGGASYVSGSLIQPEIPTDPLVPPEFVEVNYHFDANNREIESYTPVAELYRLHNIYFQGDAPDTQVYDAQGRLIKTVNSDGEAEYYYYDEDYYAINAGPIASVDIAGYLHLMDASKVSETPLRIGYDIDSDINTLVADIYDFALAGDQLTPRSNNAALNYIRYDIGSESVHAWMDADGRRIAEVDALGQLTTWQYDADPLLKTPLSVTYYTNPVVSGLDETSDINALILEAQGANDHTINNFGQFSASVTNNKIYDATGNLVKIIDGNGYITYSFYDGNNRLIVEVDAMGYVTQYGYDALGNKISQLRYAEAIRHRINENTDIFAVIGLESMGLNADNRLVEYDYDNNNRLITERKLDISYQSTVGLEVTDHQGNAETGIQYDAVGQIIRKAEPGGTEYADFDYDSMGRAVQVTESSFTDYQGVSVSKSSRFEYDALGRVEREINEGVNDASEDDDQIKTYVYGADERVLTETQYYDSVSGANTSGIVVNYGYDRNGNVKIKSEVRTDADLVVAQINTRFNYDGLNRETQRTDAVGLTYETKYNGLGKITEKGVNNQGQEYYEYDRLGNVFKTNNGNGTPRVYLYDANGNAVVELQSKDANLTLLSFDEIFNPYVSTLTDSDVQRSISIYDGLNRLTAVYQPPMEFIHRTGNVSQEQQFVQGDPFISGSVALAPGGAPAISFVDSYVLSNGPTSGDSNSGSPILRSDIDMYIDLSGLSVYGSETIKVQVDMHYIDSHLDWAGINDFDSSRWCYECYRYSFSEGRSIVGDVFQGPPGAPITTFNPLTLSNAPIEVIFQPGTSVGVIPLYHYSTIQKSHRLSTLDNIVKLTTRVYIGNDTTPIYQKTIENDSPSYGVTPTTGYDWYAGSGPAVGGPANFNTLQETSLPRQIKLSGQMNAGINDSGWNMNFYYRSLGSTGAYNSNRVATRTAAGEYVVNWSGVYGDWEYYYELKDAGGVLKSKGAGAIHANGTVENQAYQPDYYITNLADSLNDPYLQLTSIQRSQKYNAFNEVLEEIDGNGNITRFDYNKLGNLTDKMDPKADVTLNNGYVVVNHRGHTSYYYDINGRQIAYRDARANADLLLGRSTDFNVATYALELEGGRLAMEYFADGGVKYYGYDIFGNKRFERRSLTTAAHLQQFEYDKNNRLIKVTRPSGHFDQYEYDEAGQRIAHKGVLHNEASVEGDADFYREKSYYDAVGRLVKYTSYQGRSTIYSYDYRADIGGIGGFEKITRHEYDVNQNGVIDTSKDRYGDLNNVDNTDYFGRAIYHQDYGKRSYRYFYNYAGWLTHQIGRTTELDINGDSLSVLGVANQLIDSRFDPSNVSYEDAYGATDWSLYQVNNPEIDQMISYDYYQNGLLKSVADAGINSFTKFEYDNDGNKIFEGYTEYTGSSQNYYQYSTVSYDALNRVTRIMDPKYDIEYQYDANGNKMHVKSTYHDIQGGYVTGTPNTTAVQDLWYDYDKMNRFIYTMGDLTGPAANSATDTTVRVDTGNGYHIAYNQLNQRADIYYLNGDGTGINHEHYGYTPNGYLEYVNLNGEYAAWRDVDAAGVLRGYYENDLTVIINSSGGTYTGGYQKSAPAEMKVINEHEYAYDKDGIMTKDRVINYDDTGAVIENKGLDYTSYDAVGNLLETVSFDDYNANPVITNTNYSYEYWDQVKQSEITTTVSSVSNWKPGFSDMQYDVNGHLKLAIDHQYDNGGGRSLGYINDHNGQVLRRFEIQSGQTLKTNYFYYLDGKGVGEIKADSSGVLETTKTDYVQILASRDDDPDKETDRDAQLRLIAARVSPVGSADFDQNYQPISPTYPRTTPGNYIVSQGDTLTKIALSLWGDSSLWYLLADTNGLQVSGDTVLTNGTLAEGSQLIVPNVVTNIHNNASTFRPYDAGKAIGDTSPTLPDPPPPPKPSCAKQLVAVVVTAVVAFYTAGAAIGWMGMMSGNLLFGVIAGAAVGAAAGNIAGQLTSIKLGLQDDFSWSQVGTAALVGGVTAGVTYGVSGIKGILNQYYGGVDQVPAKQMFKRGLLNNITTQYIRVQRDEQDKFHGSQLIAAGVMGYYGNELSVRGSNSDIFNRIATNTTNNMISQGVSALARAQDGIDWQSAFSSGVASGVTQTLMINQRRDPMPEPERMPVPVMNRGPRRPDEIDEAYGSIYGSGLDILGHQSPEFDLAGIDGQRSVTVQGGQTLSGIIEQNYPGMGYDPELAMRIALDNGLASPHDILPGQELNLRSIEAIASTNIPDGYRSDYNQRSIEYQSSNVVGSYLDDGFVGPLSVDQQFSRYTYELQRLSLSGLDTDLQNIYSGQLITDAQKLLSSGSQNAGLRYSGLVNTASSLGFNTIMEVKTEFVSYPARISKSGPVEFEITGPDGELSPVHQIELERRITRIPGSVFGDAYMARVTGDTSISDYQTTTAREAIVGTLTAASFLTGYGELMLTGTAYRFMALGNAGRTALYLNQADRLGTFALYSGIGAGATDLVYRNNWTGLATSGLGVAADHAVTGGGYLPNVVNQLLVGSPLLGLFAKIGAYSTSLYYAGDRSEAHQYLNE